MNKRFVYTEMLSLAGVSRYTFTFTREKKQNYIHLYTRGKADLHPLVHTEEFRFTSQVHAVEFKFTFTCACRRIQIYIHLYEREKLGLYSLVRGGETRLIFTCTRRRNQTYIHLYEAGKLDVYSLVRGEKLDLCEG